MTTRRGGAIGRLTRALVLVALCATGLAIATAQPAFATATWKISTAPSPPGPPSGYLNTVSCATATNCFAAGSADSAQGIVAQHWNGSTWSLVMIPLPAGATGGVIDSISCKSGGPCFGVGSAVVGSIVKTLAVRWNGASWSVVPTPNPPSTNASYLFGVSCTSSGPCMAVGYFTSGPQKLLTERWNGSAWSIVPIALPAGSVSGYFRSVSCATSTSCRAVGQFQAASGTKTLVERWDGAGWAPQTSPKPSGATLTSFSGVSCPTTVFCEAVGYYATTNGGPAKTLIERWNGSSWSVVASPNPGADDSLLAVSCVSNTMCLATGYFFNSDNTTLAERWNGSAWQVVPSVTPNGSAVLNAAECASASLCFAGGNTNAAELLEHGNGSSLTLDPPPAGASQSELLATACPTAASCIAVGKQFDGSSTKTLVERWNGSTWSVVASPNPSGSTFALLSGVTCTSPTFCVAVGSSTKGATTKTLVERWNGASWSIVASPNHAGTMTSELWGASCANNASCVAVGDYFTSGNYHMFAARWNGSGWSETTVPAPGGATGGYFLSVACRSASMCVGVGSWTGGTTKTLVERWNGATWSVVSSPNGAGATTSRLRAVTCTSTTACVAVGDAYGSGVDKTLAERWNGAAWSVVASPNPAGSTNTILFGLSCTASTSCFAVGSSTSAGFDRAMVQHWNGATWSADSSPKPSGLRSALYAVKCTGTTSCTAVGVNHHNGNYVLVERYS